MPPHFGRGGHRGDAVFQSEKKEQKQNEKGYGKCNDKVEHEPILYRRVYLIH